MSIKKAIALILVLAIMAAGGYYLLKTERADDERMRSLYEEVEPLERQREALSDELRGLNTEYALKMRDYGTVEILFTELEAQIISDVWPIMRERGVVGVLGINATEMPGTYNRLRWDDVVRLLADGWGACLMFNQDVGSFTTWYSNLASYFALYDLDAPDTIYFINNNYTEEMNEELLACGVRNIILNGTDGRSNTVTDPEGELWITYAMPWNYTGASVDTELLGRTDGANLVFTMGLNEVWNKTKNKNVESQEAASFTAVLDSWQEMLYTDSPLDELDQVGPTPYLYVDTNDPDVLHEIYLSTLTPEQQLLLPKFRSANVSSARNYHLQAKVNAVMLTAEKDARVAEIQEEMDTLEAQIRSVYERYGVGSSMGTQGGTE